MDRKAVLAYLGADWAGTLDLVRSTLESDIELLNLTNSAILDRSGKQLRPMLSLLVARACGGDCTQDSRRFAAASELLHNATLLHDDVADNSSTRRGAPTVFSLLGGRASVLVGDFWLVKAVELVLSASHNTDSVIRIFSKTLSDLAEGEMLQLQKAASADTTEQDYLRIIYSKTASLFETACVAAAVSVEAPQEMVEAVREYAVNLGIAFQIKDDLLDYGGQDIGKPVGVDLREQKITLPLLGALSAVPQEEQNRIRGMVKDIPQHPENVDEVVAFVVANGGVQYAQERLAEFRDKAIDAISSLAESQARGYLMELAEYTAARDI